MLWLAFLGLGLLLAGLERASSGSPLQRPGTAVALAAASITGESGSRPVRNPGELIVSIEVGGRPSVPLVGIELR